MTITVRFEGICTHITYPYPPERHVAHRVVLPKAFSGFSEHVGKLVIPEVAASEADVRAFAVEPQLQYLRIQDGNHSLAVDGVSFAIETPTGTALISRTKRSSAASRG